MEEHDLDRLHDTSTTTTSNNDSAGAGCAVCASRRRVVLFTGPDRLVRLPGSFSMVRCPDCGLIYQWPQPSWETLQPHYEHEYPIHADPARHTRSRLSRLLLHLGPRKQRRYVERFCVGGRLLDIGCGNGDFLHTLQRSGRWRLFGLEPTPAAARATARRLALPILPHRIEDVALQSTSLDVITMWNVLEHVEAPIAVLQKVWEALKPGGYLVLATPNPASFSRYLFGPYWIGWELPRHLFIYSPQVLERMLTEHGFSIVDRRCFMGSYTVFGLSLGFWMQSWPARFQPLARRVQRVYASPLTRAALYPAQIVVEQLKRATIICMAARKPYATT